MDQLRTDSQKVDQDNIKGQLAAAELRSPLRQPHVMQLPVGLDGACAQIVRDRVAQQCAADHQHVWARHALQNEETSNRRTRTLVRDVELPTGAHWCAYACACDMRVCM